MPYYFPSRSLTWALHQGGIPRRLQVRELTAAIARAFGAWEAAGVLTFRQARAAEAHADIHIKFADTPDNVFSAGDTTANRLAYAFYPWTPWRGHLYIDPSDKWTLSRWNPFAHYLPAVLCHEIGHALGLTHSASGIMHPSYSRSARVTPDDVAKLRALVLFTSQPIAL